MTETSRFQIAVIPGDGVGPEVTGVAVDLMKHAAALEGVQIETTEFPWGAELYRESGRAMPVDAPGVLREFHSVFLGSLGHPDLPDHEVVGSLIQLRKQLKLAVNLRPVDRWPGVPTRYRDDVRADFLVIRENLEGEYTDIGGRTPVGSAGEVAFAVAVHSEEAIASLARFAFEEAEKRKGVCTLITKSNAIHHAFSLWEDVVGDVGAEFPDVKYERQLVDSAAARMIQEPETLDVVLCSNLFGDILSEIGSTLQGGLGMAPSGNIPISRKTVALFEPIHGSAPDLAGRGIANPVGAILSTVMLLEYLGARAAASRLKSATKSVVTSGRVMTRDLGGTANSRDMHEAVTGEIDRGWRADK